MKIAVVGTGYVGLVVGACLAENGSTVTCVDKDEAKIATLNAGKMTIYEPGLEEMVRRNRSEERLSFTTDLASAVRVSEVVFVAVGTPEGEDGSADLKHVLSVARDVGRAMNKYTVVVDKSAVPVGTALPVPVFATTVVALTLIGFFVTSAVNVSPAFAALGGALILAVPAIARGLTTVRDVALSIDVPFLAFVLALGLVVKAISLHGLGSVVTHLVPGGSGLG